MIKKTITYENFDGIEVTEDFFFNFTKAELIELEASEEGGISAMIERLEKSKKGAEILSIFKKIILQAYGEKSADGKRFVKNAEIREAFQATEAYSSMFMEMATDAEIGAEFFNGLIPKNVEQIVEAERKARGLVADRAAEASASGMSASEMARARSEANLQGHRKTAQSSQKPVPELETVTSNLDAAETGGPAIFDVASTQPEQVEDPGFQEYLKRKRAAQDPEYAEYLRSIEQ